MADENDLSGKVGLDTTGFRLGVTDLNAQIRSIETGFRASAAVMGNWSSTAEGLTSRTSSLTEKLELQKQKLETLHNEYTKTVNEQGAASAAAASLANQMYSAEKAISSTEADIKKYNAQLEAMKTDENSATEETKHLGNAMESAGKSAAESAEKHKSFMSSIGSGVVSGVQAAGAAIAGMGVAAAGAAAGLGRMVMSASENADNLQKLADTTGMSAEQLQTLNYIGSAVGVSLDTMTGAQSKLIKSMAAAEKGTGSQAEAFKSLGISVTDSNGKLRDSNTVFQEAVTKLGAMKNPTEQSATAMQLFGKSAMELNPLIRAGGDQIAELAAQAQATGAIMSNETVSQLDAFGDSVDALKLSAKGMAGSLSAMALPALNSFTSLVGNLAISLNKALKTGDFSSFGQTLADGVTSALGQLSGMMTKMVPIATKILTGLVSAVVTAIPTVLPALTTGVVQLVQSIATIMQTNGPMLIAAGVQAIMTLVSGLITALPQLLTAGMTMLSALIEGIAQALPQLIPEIIVVIGTLVKSLYDNLPLIIKSGMDLLMGLVKGLVAALPQLVAMLPSIIASMVNYINTSLPIIIKSGLEILIALINGIIQALPQLLAMLPTIITTIVDVLTKNLPLIIDAAIQIMVAIIGGLIQAIPQLVEAIPQIITALVNGFGSFAAAIGDIGKHIVEGIWQGITGAAGWLASKVSGFVDGIVAAFTGKKGIDAHSPSLLFAKFGGYMAQGIGVGFSDGMNSVVDEMRQSIPTDLQMSGTYSAKGTSSMSGTEPTRSLDSTNAIISAINMAVNKISSSNASSIGSQSLNLDDSETGRFLIRLIGKAAQQAGMVDTSGYLKIKVGAL